MFRQEDFKDSHNIGVDFEKSTNIGDACYYLVRVGRAGTKVMRQWLRGNHPDPACQKEVIEEKDIPPELMDDYKRLVAGDVPAVT